MTLSEAQALTAAMAAGEGPDPSLPSALVPANFPAEPASNLASIGDTVLNGLTVAFIAWCAWLIIGSRKRG